MSDFVTSHVGVWIETLGNHAHYIGGLSHLM